MVTVSRTLTIISQQKYKIQHHKCAITDFVCVIEKKKVTLLT